MKEASVQILAELSKRGYRLTDARKSIVEKLSLQKQPITTQALSALVVSDETSVYRTIAMLIKEGFLEELTLQGEVSRYALVDGHGHHHHVVCNVCGFVAHVPCGSISMQKKTPADFKSIFSHEVTLYGLCKKCA